MSITKSNSEDRPFASLFDDILRKQDERPIKHMISLSWNCKQHKC